MTDKIMEMFDGMEIGAIEAMVKDVIRPYLKARKAKEKQDLIDSVKNQLSDGDLVTVRFKDGVVEGIVVALRDKTFSILTEDVLNAKGEPSRISRGYNFVEAIGKTDETFDDEVDETFDDESLENGLIEDEAI
jgi:hypothetical protein